MNKKEPVKTEIKKLDLTVKAAGQLGRVYVTPGMMFNKA